MTIAAITNSESGSSVRAKLNQVIVQFGFELDPDNYSGLDFAVKSGRIQASDGSSVFVDAQLVTLPDNATSRVYLDSSGILSWSASVATGGIPLYVVETASGLIVPETIADIRTPYSAPGGVADSIRGADVTTDTAPNPASAHGGNAYAQATGGNQAGADLNLSGGIGSRFFTVVDWTALAGKIVTIVTNDDAVGLTEGVEWAAETSNAITAQNLATAIGATATAVGDVVYITPAATARTLTISTDAGADLTATSGADGSISGLGFITQTKVTTAQFDVTDDDELANIPGLSVQIKGQATYTFEAVLFTTSDVAAGVNGGIMGSLAESMAIYEIDIVEAGAIVAQARRSTIPSDLGFTAVTIARIEITGTVVVDTIGSLNVAFSQNISDASTSSVLIGSKFSVTRVF